MGKRNVKDGLSELLVALVLRVILKVALALPYRLRVRLFGKLFTYIFAPLAGWRRRIRNNLLLALPHLPGSEVRRIERAVPENFGRTLIEIYSGDEFIAQTAESPIEGPGLMALENCRSEGRPVVLVTAHVGNYDVVRGKLSRAGYPMAALYKPMSNRFLNAHYVKALSRIAEPIFPTDKRGILGLVRQLKQGGIIGIVADVGSTKSPILSFFGRPAHTPLSAAEWAIEYDALMIPVFGLRQPDGLSFRIFVAEPIPVGSSAEMMQHYNDTLEEIVNAYLDQWFWVHRRWKGATGN